MKKVKINGAIFEIIKKGEDFVVLRWGVPVKGLEKFKTFEDAEAMLQLMYRKKK